MPSFPFARPKAQPALWRLGDGAPPEGPFIALVPGADAPLISVTLPATLKGDARDAVARRQIRDRLGASFEVRTMTQGAFTRVAVAERSRVLDWRARLGRAAARCRGLMPDYLGLPAAKALWVIEAGTGTLRARLGTEDGFSAETALAGQMLQAALSDARAAASLPRAVLLSGEGAAALAPLFDGIPVAHDPAGLPDGLTPALLAQGETRVDFARDPAADGQLVEVRLRRALWPALLVLAGALGWAGAQALAIRHDRAEAEAIRAEVLAAVRRDILPGGPIIDLERQVLRAIAERQGDAAPPQQGAPLDLLHRAAPVLDGVQAIALDAIALDATGLRVSVRLPDFRALDALVARLAGDGISAVAETSGMAEGGVSAVLLLEDAP